MNQYQIPLHFCQWCFKNTGRFIVDCLCLVCEACFKAKKDWIDQQNKCFNCNKQTTRKFIDLKTNPQQGGFYFQNISNSIRNTMRIQQFQQQVTKKYCKHLEGKVNKLEKIIRSFITQFPHYGNYFENAFRQIQQKQNNSLRSKSANQLQIPQNNGKFVQQNNTERYVPSKQQQVINKPQSNYKNNNNYQNFNQRTLNQQPNYQKNQKNNSMASKTSHASMQGMFQKPMYMNQPNPKIQGFQPQQKLKHLQSVQKANIRKDGSKILINPKKGLMQSNQFYQQNGPSQVYMMAGSKQFSDPTKQSNLNNNMNIQTALKSIRSSDERLFPPMQIQDPQYHGQMRQMNNYRNNQQQNHQNYAYMNPNNGGMNMNKNNQMNERFIRKTK